MLTVLVLLVMSALVSGSEVAFFNLSPRALHDLEQEDNPRAQNVLALMRSPNNVDGPRNLLGTILVINNLVNVSIVLIATVLAEQLFPSDAMPLWLGTLIHVVGVTFLLVLFGEVIPKIYATSFGVDLAKLMAAPLLLSQRVLRPVWKPLVGMGRWMDDKLANPTADISVEDLEQALELTDNAERSEEEQRILEGIVNFGSKDAKQVMTPRTDMLSFSIEDTWEHVRATIVASGFSRIPVHEGSVDQIQGVLHVKDLLPRLQGRPSGVDPGPSRPDVHPGEQEDRRPLEGVPREKSPPCRRGGRIRRHKRLGDVGRCAGRDCGGDRRRIRRGGHHPLRVGRVHLLDGSQNTVCSTPYRILQLDEEAWEAAKGESDTLGGFMLEQAGRMLKRGESMEFAGPSCRSTPATPVASTASKWCCPGL